jgi:hypothetical protein
MKIMPKMPVGTIYPVWQNLKEELLTGEAQNEVNMGIIKACTSKFDFSGFIPIV